MSKTAPKFAKWKVYDGANISPIFNGIVCMIAADEQVIAVITEDECPVPRPEWLDIAHLIAAAPDMLEALMAVDALGMLNPTGSGAVEDAARAVKASIAKAVSP